MDATQITDVKAAGYVAPAATVDDNPPISWTVASGVRPNMTISGTIVPHDLYCSFSYSTGGISGGTSVTAKWKSDTVELSTVVDGQYISLKLREKSRGEYEIVEGGEHLRTFDDALFACPEDGGNAKDPSGILMRIAHRYLMFVLKSLSPG